MSDNQEYNDKDTNQTGDSLTETQLLAISNLRGIEEGAVSVFQDIMDLANAFNDSTLTGQEVDIATFKVGLRSFKSGISTMVEAVAQPKSAVYRVLNDKGVR